MSIEIPRRQFSVEQYYRMAETGILPEDAAVELIEGEIVNMPAIGSRHAACVNRLNMLLTRSMSEGIVVAVQNPVRLDSRSEPQPDLALLRPRPDFYAESHPGPADVLLLVEVSETSLEYDRAIKVPLYARAGIQAVWIVALLEGSIEVYSEPQGGKYANVARVGRGDHVSITGVTMAPVAVEDILGKAL